jgi:hypothetical protein
MKRLLLSEEPVPTPAPSTNTMRRVAEVVQSFITAMDCIKLELTAADQLAPLITELCDSLCSVEFVSAEWEGLVKVKQWYQ